MKNLLLFSFLISNITFAANVDVNDIVKKADQKEVLETSPILLRLQ